MSGPEDIYNDELGQAFCKKHMRESCHVCGYDFTPLNNMVMIDKGLKKPPSKIEKLSEEKVMIESAIKFMENNMRRDPSARELMKEDMDYHLKQLAECEKKIARLLEEGQVTSQDVAKTLQQEQMKEQCKQAELAAVTQAWSQQNPGKSHMQYGGEETQQLFDKFAQAPPSSLIDRPDKLSCNYCGKISAVKLMCCARCKKVLYCGVECQKAAWKGHKLVCKPIGIEPEAPPAKKVSLPLTWGQVAAFNCMPAEGKVLEVRILVVDYFGPRQILQCKDRVGDVRKIAAYTDSKRIPKAASGKILRWKNPCLHQFMDGSNGARIEEEDLDDITIADN